MWNEKRSYEEDNWGILLGGEREDNTEKEGEKEEG